MVTRPQEEARGEAPPLLRPLSPEGSAGSATARQLMAGITVFLREGWGGAGRRVEAEVQAGGGRGCRRVEAEGAGAGRHRQAQAGAGKRMRVGSGRGGRGSTGARERGVWKW